MENEVKKGQVYKCRDSAKRGFTRTLTVIGRSMNPDRWWVDSYNSVTGQTRRITVRADRLVHADYELVNEAPKGQLELAIEKAEDIGSWTLRGDPAYPKTYQAMVGAGPLITADTPEQALKSALEQAPKLTEAQPV